jgi:hypothetical protein
MVGEGVSADPEFQLDCAPPTVPVGTFFDYEEVAFKCKIEVSPPTSQS